MNTTEPAAPAKKRGLTTAVPVRFDDEDRAMIDDLVSRTGLKAADIVRRAVRFAAPKFRSGEVNIGDLTTAK